MATRKQHYIPRMILKHHTCFFIPMREPMIYQYDRRKGIHRLVDIYDVCRKNNLYEMKDENGKIINKNLIENNFSILEQNWDTVILKIINEEPLSEKDKDWMCLLVVLQLVRMPAIMEATKDWVHKMSKIVRQPLSSNASDRCAKVATFVHGKVDAETHGLLIAVLDFVLSNNKLVIFHSNTNFILNGGRPVLCIQRFIKPDIDAVSFFFPITSHYCLSLSNQAEDTPLYIDIPDALTNIINGYIFSNDSRYIYSSKPISPNIINNKTSVGPLMAKCNKSFS